MKRNTENDKKLLFLGWIVIHFWGSDITKKTEECITVIEGCIFESKIAVADCYDIINQEEHTNA